MDGDILAFATAFAPAIADQVAKWISDGHKLKSADLILIIQADSNKTLHDLVDMMRNDHAAFHCAFEDVIGNQKDISRDIARVDVAVTKKD